MFLITGCGRSGTLYMKKVLTIAGLDVGHQCLGSDGAISPAWCMDDRHYSYHPEVELPEWDVVLHQVRHPLDVIASMTMAKNAGWRFLCRHVPTLEMKPELIFGGAHYWYYWNKHVEQMSLFTYRIEDLPESWTRITQAIGHPGLQLDGRVSTKTHAREHRDVSWDEVQRKAPGVYSDVRTMARKYGYEV